MTTLTIRYAHLNTTPAVHKARGFGISVPTVQPGLNDDVWTLTGSREALTAHVKRALVANDLNCYRIAS